MRILVIDDEVEVANLLAEAVRLEGHESMVAYDGGTGLASIDRERPDAVFLDVRLPDVSGIEVLRRIRRSAAAPLPVVLITGHGREEEIEEARRLGVTEVVHKPEVLANLTAAIAALRAPHR